MAPVRQRNEARAELVRADEIAKFPRGRIAVKEIGYFDKEGQRFLVFEVKVTNRESALRMNLELDFVLRQFTSVAKMNPPLKPFDTKLRRLELGHEDLPPHPLIVDAQASSPELTYLIRWDEYMDELEFEGDGIDFRPKSDDDQLVLVAFDLQTGGRIEIPIPGIWET
jgi:hypothetical protein